METQELTERLNKQELEQRLDAIKSDIQWMYTPNRPLCKRPSREELKERFGFDRLDNLRHDIFKGSHMRTYRFGADENVWTFPDDLKEKIEDDKDYKVWYTWHDAADPADMSTYHHVYYIEEVSAGKMAVVQFLKQLISEIN